MKKRSILTAIDVGTTKVCTIVAEKAGEGKVRVVGVGLTPSKGMHKGLVVSIDEARESVRQSVRKAEIATGHKIESAYVGVTGRHVSSVNNRGVLAITRGDRVVRAEDLKKVMQSAQAVRVPNDRKLLHVIPRRYAVDDQPVATSPVGMHATKLDVETHIITAAMANIQNLVKCIRSAGIDIDDLVLEPIASSEAVLTEKEKQDGVILADIGGGTTDICVFREGSIWHTAVLPIAGYQLTRDVAVGLGVPFDVAEELKRRYGSVLPVYEGGTQRRDTIPGDGHNVSYQDLCDIVRARFEEILRLILLELPSTDFKKLVPAGMVLTGGSSNLSGLAELGQHLLRIPVRVGAPIEVEGLSDVLFNPAHATGMGLVLWGSRQQTEEQSRRVVALPAQVKNLVLRFRGLFNR